MKTSLCTKLNAHAWVMWNIFSSLFNPTGRAGEGRGRWSCVWIQTCGRERGRLADGNLLHNSREWLLPFQSSAQKEEDREVWASSTPQHMKGPLPPFSHAYSTFKTLYAGLTHHVRSSKGWWSYQVRIKSLKLQAVCSFWQLHHT